ncbi:filamentous hemagglutinin N-terminal domain-containing protein [Aliarcobacter cryaerophilus]|uniref:two-partner secretion domain-containing protein n=1 Tax=Aliarcobacter cryaerophilus TaxID=28198 RepID=UPI003BAF9C5C
MYLKQDFRSSFRILKGGKISLVVSAILGSVIVGNASPSGGVVTSGNATINQNGNTTNINQSSQKASINWQDFSIAKNETVNFNQPNQNSITLNRVIGNEKSIIDGALNANGQVWILNSNGTLFGKNAKVNTSGLLVTTKNLSDDDFQKGNYSFKGNSIASIENQGEINLNDKAYAVFVANSVVNNGTIQIHKGTVHLTGADEFSLTLNENSNISLKVTKGTLNSLVENNNLIVANGGNVYLTTNAKNELLKGVVNNSGIIEANSLDDITGKQSEVIIFAHGGTANIDGEIKAKNSFVETSGENLNVSANTKVIAKTWLLDPVNMTIESTGGNSLTGASVSAIAIQNALGGTNVELQADNNITVNQNITWSTDKQLKLSADSINVNATINNTNKTNGGVYFNAANNQSKVVFGTNGKVIVNNVYQLQWINTALGGKYELGSNIDASATSTWDSNKGFNPIGNSTNVFNGNFDGKNYMISNLIINRPSTSAVGLFGFTDSGSLIENIGLDNVNIKGHHNSGGLAGESHGTVKNSYVKGIVDLGSGAYVGGFVGANRGTIENSYFEGTVIGDGRTGGFVGWNAGVIRNSYFKGTVTGTSFVGGLVSSGSGTIENSYTSGTVNGIARIGGLIGQDLGFTINNSWYDNQANSSGTMEDAVYGKTKAEIVSLITGSEWETDLTKGRGYSIGGTTDLPFLKNVTKFSNTLFEDGLGTSTNPYTITNWTQLQNINNSNILSQNYYFNLVNNLSSSTTDYTNLASNTANGGLGWNSIGWDYTNYFKGTFDGLGNTISNLYISRSGIDYIGLFGWIDGATIKNLGLVGVDIIGNDYTGSVVGINYGSNAIVQNVYSNGTVRGHNYVGGLVGYNYAERIENSYSSGTVSGNNMVGGLSGYNDNGIIKNSYSTASITRNHIGGGLVGYSNGTIEKSFYDSTKFTGNGVGNGSQTGVTALTTQQMSYGGIFKNATWNIRADSSVTSLTPILKYDSATKTTYWAISPISLNYNLGNKSSDYNGNIQNLSSLYSSAIVIPSGYEFLNADYKFQKDGIDVVGYKDANTYLNIKVALAGTSASDEFLTIASSGNTDGNLTINRVNATVDVTSNQKTYNGSIQDFNYSITGLVGDDTASNLALTGLQTTSKNVNTYTSNIGGTNSNYNLTFNQGDLEITKAELDIVANSDSFVYNGLNQSVSGYTIGTNKLLGSDTIADINLSNLTTIAKNVGTYATAISGTANNYNINVTQGELKIIAESVTPTPIPTINNLVSSIQKNIEDSALKQEKDKEIALIQVIGEAVSIPENRVSSMADLVGEVR